MKRVSHHLPAGRLYLSVDGLQPDRARQRFQPVLFRVPIGWLRSLVRLEPPASVGTGERGSSDPVRAAAGVCGADEAADAIALPVCPWRVVAAESGGAGRVCGAMAGEAPPGRDHDGLLVVPGGDSALYGPGHGAVFVFRRGGTAVARIGPRPGCGAGVFFVRGEVSSGFGNPGIFAGTAAVGRAGRRRFGRSDPTGDFVCGRGQGMAGTIAGAFRNWRFQPVAFAHAKLVGANARAALRDRF